MEANDGDRWRQLATALIGGMVGVCITMLSVLLSEIKEIKSSQQTIALELARLNGEQQAMKARLEVQDAAKIRGEKR